MHVRADLLSAIASDIESCGLVGEETGALLVYLTATSRKLPRPLAVWFTRSDLRAETCWGDTQLKIHLSRLVDMEYLHIKCTGYYRRHLYQLTSQPLPALDQRRLPGLVDVESSKAEGKKECGMPARIPHPSHLLFLSSLYNETSIMLTRKWATECYAERLAALPPEMGRAIEAYADHMVVQRYSDWYVFSSRYYTVLFCEWAAEREITRPQDITLQTLESYLRYIYHHRRWRGKRIGVQSQRHHLAIVSCWLKWLHHRELIPHNPASRLKLPRKPKRLPRGIFTREEVETLMALPDLDKPTGFRNRTMLEVMYATAMRRAELTGLLLDDLWTQTATQWTHHPSE